LALVFTDRGQAQGYEPAVVRAFIEGYRSAGGQFAFSGPEDLAMCMQGRLWRAAQNVRLAVMAGPESDEQRLARLCSAVPVRNNRSATISKKLV
jgi:hypothetical protein